MRNGNIALLCLAVLTGCGGGGGGGGDSGPPPPATVNAAAAWQNVITSQRTVTATGQASDGRTYLLAYTVTPGAVVSLNGVDARRVDLSGVLKRDGTTVSTTTSTVFLRSGSTQVIALQRSDGSCALIPNGSVPPASAVINQSGALYAADIQSSCSTLDFSFERETNTWSVEADGSAALFCINTTSTGLAIVSPHLQQMCVQTNASGAIGGVVRVSITSGTLSMILRG